MVDGTLCVALVGCGPTSLYHPRAWVGAGADSRCLSIKLAGADLVKTELFDWVRDRAAGHDLSAAETGLLFRLAGELEDARWDAVAPAVPLDPSAETTERLRALGYVN